MRYARVVASILMLGVSGAAMAYHCPSDMKAIDAKLETKPALSAEDAARVKQLRADGEALHKAGKHDESLKNLAEARKILGI